MFCFRWARGSCTSEHGSHVSVVSNFDHKACSDHGDWTKAAFIQIFPQINTLVLKVVMLEIKHFKNKSFILLSYSFSCPRKNKCNTGINLGWITLKVSQKDLLWEGVLDVCDMYFRFSEQLQDLWSWRFLMALVSRIYLSIFVLAHAKFLVMNLLSSYFHFSI